MSELEQLLATASQAISVCDGLKDIEALRVQYLGKKGLVTEQLKRLGQLSAAERPAAGQRINEVKQAIQAQLETKTAQLQTAAIDAKLKSETIDVTLSGRTDVVGTLHPSHNDRPGRVR